MMGGHHHMYHRRNPAPVQQTVTATASPVVVTVTEPPMAMPNPVLSQSEQPVLPVEGALPEAPMMARTQWQDPKPLPDVCPVKVAVRKSSLKRPKKPEEDGKEVGNAPPEGDIPSTPLLSQQQVADQMVPFPVTVAVQELSKESSKELSRQKMSEKEELQKSRDAESKAKRQKVSTNVVDTKKRVHISSAAPQTTTIPANEPKRLYRISGVVELTAYDPLHGAATNVVD
jgi:hypothetical protein